KYTLQIWTGLLVLCSTLSPALCCDWLRHYGHYSNMSLSLLRLMGGQVTEQESPVPFPYRFYISIRTTEVRSQVVFVRDSLVQIADLYRHGNLSSVTWDTDRTNGFRMSLDRQIDELRSCTKDQVRLQNLVQFRGGGSAYWQLIRKETQLHLEQLDLLVNSIRSSVVSTSVQG
uniref:Interferon a3-like n=1 Tax=Echeneis naucrates TaxID=173247 RepID=A0A665WNK9_ECHNA